jgi:hypothetical protein
MAGHIKMEWTNALCPREQWFSILPAAYAKGSKPNSNSNSIIFKFYFLISQLVQIQFSIDLGPSQFSIFKKKN